MLNKSCVGRNHLPHLLILFSPSFSALYQFVFFAFFLHVKSKGGCHRRQLACLVHMIEAAATYKPERQTSLISGRLLCRCPFPQPKRMKVCRLGCFVRKQEEPLQIYTIHPSVGHGAAPLLPWHTWLSSKLSVYISGGREARRGVIITKGQFVILVSLHHSSYYLGLLSIKKKLLMRARKCVLCHYAPASDFTFHRFKLNEARGNYSSGKKKERDHADMNCLELLSCGAVETPRLILVLIFCVLIAPQHKSPWWSRRFHRRRILLLVAARLLSTCSDTSTGCSIMHPHLQEGRYFINLSPKPMIYYFHWLLETLGMIDWFILQVESKCAYQKG